MPPKPPWPCLLTRAPLPAAAPARSALHGSVRTWAATRRTRTSSPATTTPSTTVAMGTAAAGLRTVRRAAAPGARTGRRSSPAQSRRRAAVRLPRMEEALAKTSRRRRLAAANTRPQSLPKIQDHCAPLRLCCPFPAAASPSRPAARVSYLSLAPSASPGFSVKWATLQRRRPALSRALIQCRLGIVSLL